MIQPRFKLAVSYYSTVAVSFRVRDSYKVISEQLLRSEFQNYILKESDLTVITKLLILEIKQ
jgi:hypothetical protein